MSHPQVTIHQAVIHIGAGANIATLPPLNIQPAADAVAALLNPDSARFTKEPRSGIVVDPLTGLMWSHKETDELEWDAAVKACSECRLGDFADWRMPTRQELLTILDLERHNPCPPEIFETAGAPVWTATETPWSKKEERKGSSRSFFYVDMHDGLVGYYHASYQLRARPVRRAAPASQ